MWSSLRRLSDHFVPGGIIDVGAHHGAWASSASEIFDCPIHMIDARPAAEQYLKNTGFPYTIALLGRDNRASVPFHLWESGSSVMKEVTGFGNGTVRLAMQRLDDLGVDLPRPLLLKLDVQGYELEVLAGAPKTLTKTEVLLLEVSLLEYNEGQPLMHQVIAFLAERGFLPFDICGGLRRYADNALFQTDIIFVRNDSNLRAKRKFWPNER